MKLHELRLELLAIAAESESAEELVGALEELVRRVGGPENAPCSATACALSRSQKVLRDATLCPGGPTCVPRSRPCRVGVHPPGVRRPVVPQVAELRAAVA